MVNIFDLILVALAAIALASSWIKDSKKTKSAVKVSTKSFLSVLPFFLAVFALIGLIEVFVPRNSVVAFLGTSRGVLAPILAAVVGGIMTGPPAAVYPLAGFLLHQHASVAAVATFVVAWIAVGTVSVPLEVKLLGTRFALTRWILTLILSIGVGVLMGSLI